MFYFASKVGGVGLKTVGRGEGVKDEDEENEEDGDEERDEDENEVVDEDKPVALTVRMSKMTRKKNKKEGKIRTKGHFYSCGIVYK